MGRWQDLLLILRSDPVAIPEPWAEAIRSDSPAPWLQSRTGPLRGPFFLHPHPRGHAPQPTDTKARTAALAGQLQIQSVPAGPQTARAPRRRATPRQSPEHEPATQSDALGAPHEADSQPCRSPAPGVPERPTEAPSSQRFASAAAPTEPGRPEGRLLSRQRQNRWPASKRCSSSRRSTPAAV